MTLVASCSSESRIGHALPATLPPALVTCIRVACRRIQSSASHDIADVRLALEGAFETAAPPTTAHRHRRHADGWPGSWLAVAAVLAAALAIPAVRHLRETPPPAPPETRAEIVTPATDDPTIFALSPDGRQIVFVASGDGPSRLWLRSLAIDDGAAAGRHRRSAGFLSGHPTAGPSGSSPRAC